MILDIWVGSRAESGRNPTQMQRAPSRALALDRTECRWGHHPPVVAKRETAGMAFGQQSGPPAPAHTVRQLLALLHDAGHTDFRDARGPMGFTQRQAAGKFTRDEADAFIEQLEAAAQSESPSPVRTPMPRPTTAERALREVSSELLAAELQRRGWIVAEP